MKISISISPEDTEGKSVKKLEEDTTKILKGIVRDMGKRYEARLGSIDMVQRKGVGMCEIEMK